MYIYYIEVPLRERRKGNLNHLLDTLLNLGFTVKVPNAMPLMTRILKKKGFYTISDESINPRNMGTIDEVLVKEP